MTIFRAEHKKNYTVVNNFICKDKRLSWKAKGIWLYAFSRPDDWSFSEQDIINHSSDGRDGVRAGLKELQDAGYLNRSQQREVGKFANVEWVFYETPQENQKCSTKTGNPLAENLLTAIPLTENPTLLSTDNKPNIEEKLNKAPPAAFSFPSSKIQFGSHVQLTPEEKFILLEELGEEMFDFFVEQVNTYCRGDKPDGYRGSYLEVIRGYVKRHDPTKRHVQTSWKSSQEIAKEMLANFDLPKNKSYETLIDFGPSYIELGRSDHPHRFILEFSDKEFKNKLENYLLKAEFVKKEMDEAEKAFSHLMPR